MCPEFCKVTLVPTEKATKDYLGPMIQFIKTALRITFLSL